MVVSGEPVPYAASGGVSPRNRRHIGLPPGQNTKIRRVSFSCVLFGNQELIAMPELPLHKVNQELIVPTGLQEQTKIARIPRSPTKFARRGDGRKTLQHLGDGEA